MQFFRFLILFNALIASPLVGAPAVVMNGFDLSNASIPRDEIYSGGPPRDGIPSIDSPKFVPAGNVEFLKDDDMVVGLGRGKKARAYPFRILIWHEIVNDVIDGTPVAVTYCPLCGTSMVFDARVDEKVRSFGVSGLLYLSDVLMYDRETQSLWSQLKMEAVSGPDVGKKLTLLPSELLTWRAWQQKYPEGEVLSPATGHKRDYAADAYAPYFASDQIMFPVPQTRRELPNKAKILGVVIAGKSKAYPLDLLPDKVAIRDKLSGEDIEIIWNRKDQQAKVFSSSGEPIPAVAGFWFAWQAFHPNTELWKP